MSTLVLRLKQLADNDSRAKELLLALALVLAAYLAGMRVSVQYPLLFAGLGGLLVAFVMLRHQLASLLLLLFISTIHFFIKVVFFKWHPSAVVFKDGLLLLLFGFWAFELITRQGGLRRTSLLMPLVAFSAVVTLQCFNPNTYGVFTILDDYRFWIAPLMIYLLTTHLLRSREQLELALKVVFGYSVLLTAYGCIQPLLPLDILQSLGADPDNYFFFYYGTKRAFSTMGTAPFALFASMMAPLAFWYGGEQRDPLRRSVLYGAGFLFVLGVVLTLVRTGWVALTVGLLFYAFLNKQRWILVVLLVTGLMLSLFATGYTAYKWEGLMNPDEDESVQKRLQILELTREAIVFRVFGYGLGTFAQNRLGIDKIYQEKTGYGRATENFFLTLVLEMGWVGLGVYLWMLYKVYRIGFECRRGLRSRRYRALSGAILAALVVLDVAKFGGPSGYYPPEAWHYWFLVAVLVLLPRFDQQPAPSPAPEPAPSQA